MPHQDLGMQDMSQRRLRVLGRPLQGQRFQFSQVRLTVLGLGADYLTEAGLAVERVNKVAQGRPHIVDKIKDGEIDVIFNTTEGWQSHRDSASIRASAVGARIPYFTTAASSLAVVRAIREFAAALPP